MYSTAVLLILFVLGLGGIWMLLVGAGAHKKVAKKTESFKEKFNDEEND